MMSDKTERRKHRRVEHALSLKLRSESNDDIFSQTKNISCSGANCEVSAELPLMTKLAITLLVPAQSKNKEKCTTKKINCEGVVVRSESCYLPNNNELVEERYSIAIFFTEMSKSDRKCLAAYVDSLIQSPQ
ncbi:MAG: PilZ domain-containing protein [Candidatus Omnitrophica bacterium]|nr:PilZ domain-containing protein [Candidatus Omnitrophota bacterium]